MEVYSRVRLSKQIYIVFISTIALIFGLSIRLSTAQLDIHLLSWRLACDDENRK